MMNNIKSRSYEMRNAINETTEQDEVMNAILTYFYDVFHDMEKSRFHFNGGDDELICTGFKVFDQEICIQVKKNQITFENRKQPRCSVGRICVIDFDDNSVFCKVDAGAPVDFAEGYTDICKNVLMEFFKTLIDECGILIERPFLIENKCEEE